VRAGKIYKTPSNKEILNKIRIALDNFLKDDFYLLRHDLHERSLTHRLAICLDKQFPHWHVDCEYNRNHDERKLIERVKNIIDDASHRIVPEDTIAISVYPDIIVHRRGTDENLLAIEVKKSSNNISEKYDKEKLLAFKEQLGYHHTIFIKIGTTENDLGKISICEL
jgi:uncharacterized protein YehS (DUF1456 family)